MHTTPSLTDSVIEQDIERREDCTLSAHEDQGLRERSNAVGLLLVLHAWVMVG